MCGCWVKGCVFIVVVQGADLRFNCACLLNVFTSFLPWQLLRQVKTKVRTTWFNNRVVQNTVLAASFYGVSIFQMIWIYCVGNQSRHHGSASFLVIFSNFFHRAFSENLSFLRSEPLSFFQYFERSMFNSWIVSWISNHSVHKSWLATMNHTFTLHS